MQLNPQHLKIASLFERRMFRIPEYQRAYSWTTRQRNDLFHDIEEAARTDREHFMATLVALARGVRRIGIEEFTTVELVDGQQRVTTLIILLKAIEKALSTAEEEEADVKAGLTKLLVKGDDHTLILLQTNHDTSSIFLNYLRTGEITDAVVTAADRNLKSAMADCEQFVQSWQKSGRDLLHLLATIKNRLSIIYHEIADESTVYRVFEVLNSRGLAVKWIDKLKSQLMAKIYEHVEEGSQAEAVQEMQTIWRDIYRALESSTRIGDEALRFAGAWAAPSRLNRIPSEADATALLLSAAGTELKSIMQVGSHLAAVVDENLRLFKDARRSAVTRIVHARFVAAAIMLRKFDAATEAELLGKWERVTFRIYELAGKDSRHKVGDYIRLGYDICNGDLDKQKILDKFDQIAKGYSIDKVLEEVDWSNCYDGWQTQLCYLLYRYDEHLAKQAGQRVNNSQWKKIWADEPSSSIEHIMPQKSATPYIHHLGNLTMLPPGVNSSLKDKDPSEKHETYRNCGLVATSQVAAMIDEEEGWNEDLVLARAKDIEDFVRREWAD